jgi:hypothetical protein
MVYHPVQEAKNLQRQEVHFLQSTGNSVLSENRKFSIFRTGRYPDQDPICAPTEAGE